MEKIDDFVLRQYQRVGEWSQVHWDKNCYWWAYISCHASGLFCVVYVSVLFGTHGVDLDKKASLWVAVVLYLTISLLELVRLPMLKRWSQQNKPNHYPHRSFIGLLFLVFFAIDIINLNWSGVLPLSWASIHYFMRCHPLPPSMVEDRKRNLAGELQTAH